MVFSNISYNDLLNSINSKSEQDFIIICNLPLVLKRYFECNIMANKAASKEASPKKSSPKKNQKKESPVKEKRPTPAAFTKKFKLSKDLSAIIGMKEASRSEIVKELWAYLKKNNLQDPEAKQWFTPDKKMAKVFGNEKIKGFAMTKFINFISKVNF